MSFKTVLYVFRVNSPSCLDLFHNECSDCIGQPSYNIKVRKHRFSTSRWSTLLTYTNSYESG